MIERLARMPLTVNLPVYRLKTGGRGTVVNISSDGREYMIKFLTLNGETSQSPLFCVPSSSGLAALTLPMRGSLS